MAPIGTAQDREDFGPCEQGSRAGPPVLKPQASRVSKVRRLDNGVPVGMPCAAWIGFGPPRQAVFTVPASAGQFPELGAGWTALAHILLQEYPSTVYT